MNTLIEFLKGSTAKRFYWQTFDGFLGLVVVFLGGIDWIYAPVIIALIIGLTKELNKKYGNIE